MNSFKNVKRLRIIKYSLLVFTNIMVVLFFVYLTMASSYAHPGNTASDGCHYCRTNCDSWGEVYGERHCHNGGTSNERLADSSDDTSSKDDTSLWLLGTGVVGTLAYLSGKKQNK